MQTEDPAGDGARGVSDRGRLAALAKALAHPARVRIVEVLTARESRHVGELTAELPLAQSTISEHLRILREAGIVSGGWVAGRPCYCVDRECLCELRSGLDGLLDGARG